MKVSGTHLLTWLATIAAIGAGTLVGLDAWSRRSVPAQGRPTPEAGLQRPDVADAKAAAASGTDAVTTPTEVSATRAGGSAGVSTGDNVAAATAIRSGPAEPAFRIVAEPALLRVWDNTRVRLYIEPGAVAFERFVWHFEDGSPPATAPAVEHVFAESVRDRHVTVEAFAAAGPPIVVSLRLPVERLDIAHVEGARAEATALGPAHDGLRLLCAGNDAGDAELLVSVAQRIGAGAVVVASGRPVAWEVARRLEGRGSDTAVIHAPTTLDGGLPALALIRPGGFVEIERSGQAAGIWAWNDVAIVSLDTRADAIDEAALKRLRTALQVATAYPSVVLWTARPLAVLRDGELIADRAYRIYEHAMRASVSVVVSAASGVAFDGRFGGVRLASIGLTSDAGCVHLAGDGRCQPATLTAIDIGARGRVTVHTLAGPTFERAVPPGTLPAEVGKVRR